MNEEVDKLFCLMNQDVVFFLLEQRSNQLKFQKEDACFKKNLRKLRKTVMKKSIVFFALSTQSGLERGKFLSIQLCY